MSEKELTAESVQEQILALLWERQESGLEAMAAAYESRLYSLVEKILSPEDAGECVNDTYLAVWNSIPPARPDNLFAYLARICRNLAYNRIDWNQAGKRKAEVVELSEEMEQCLPQKNSTDLQEEQALGQILSEFLRGLSKENRVLFVRRYFYGDTIEELARRTGYGKSKIKTTLFRIRNQCKSYLEREGIWI